MLNSFLHNCFSLRDREIGIGIRYYLLIPGFPIAPDSNQIRGRSGLPCKERKAHSYLTAVSYSLVALSSTVRGFSVQTCSPDSS